MGKPPEKASGPTALLAINWSTRMGVVSFATKACVNAASISNVPASKPVYSMACISCGLEAAWVSRLIFHCACLFWNKQYVYSSVQVFVWNVGGFVFHIKSCVH